MTKELPFVEGIVKFNKAAGRTDHTYDPRAVSLHIGLQLEEMAEVLDAVIEGADPLHKLSLWRVVELRNTMQSIGSEFKSGMYAESVHKADRTELLDGCIDVAVVSVGNLMAQGANLLAAMQEVNNSNLAKIDPETGLCIKDANGKIQKPAGWKKPDLAQFVNSN
jgi:predicted HAD superfamily Cof-like phosphohydrolase